MFYQHPNYSSGSAVFDIGFIVLKTPIDWEVHGWRKGEEEMYINTICLPKPEVFVPISDLIPNKNPYKNATLYGWGLMANEVKPYILQRGDFFVRYYTFETKNYFEYREYPYDMQPSLV